MDNTEFQKEKENLDNIINKYQDVIDYYNIRIEVIQKTYANNSLMLNNLLEMYTSKLKLMERNIGKPYFARIDFQGDKEEKIEKFYIGKVGVMDEDNNNITVDWRAPISSIYYDSNIGKTSYKAPGGICTGKLLLKRQYEIEHGKLKSMQDVDTVSNDELLKPYLNSNADSRLKNIVSTIQQEQNAIIREPISKNIIIQGVAGSGKTTVALHRIAYLVYNYREQVKMNQYLVIGPNKFFINYISNILPDLDVDNVKQLTYEELCAEVISEDITLINEEKKLIESINGKETLQYEKFKVSMNFKKVLDEFIVKFEEDIISDKNIVLKGYEIIPNSLIKNLYYSIEDSSIYNSIKRKLDRTKLMLLKYVEDNYDTIRNNIKIQYDKNININSKENELNKLNLVEKELKNGCKSIINKYFKNLIPNIKKIYINFLSSMENYLEPRFYTENKLKIQNNIINMKEKKIEFEDLSALIYLKCKIQGEEPYNQYKHVAIDEAQDLGDFSFYALKSLLKNATFSIFGDLAQSIFQYRGIENWDTVVHNTFNNNVEIKYLLKSYRTTTEIMLSANNITNYINLNSAKPVIRHGNKVNYKNYNNEKNQIDSIKNILKEYEQKKYKSIAIICKNNMETSRITDELKKEKINVNNITNSDTQYNGGICTITSYLSKGLEFDGVIVSNASEGEYDSNKNIDMKLLYVSMTRPLHELNILYHDNIVRPLRQEINHVNMTNNKYKE